MKYYVGLDVRHKQTAICVIEGSGAVAGAITS
jgi:hypothetical protein